MSQMLYKAADEGQGEHLPQHGGWFALLVVDESDVPAKQAEGWHMTPADALDRPGEEEIADDDGVGNDEEPKPKRKYTRRKVVD